jgi:Domain of unknown function (DUF4157)
MATDVASADAEKKPDSDARPKAVEEKHDGTSAASTAPAVQRAAGTSLGQRQVQAKSAHGNARIGDGDDSAERKADMAADHVMRMPDTSPPPPAAASPSAPAPAAASPSAPAPASTPTPTTGAGSSPASASPSPAPAPASPSPASGGAPTGTSATVSRSPAPGGAPAATPDEPVRRAEDPTAEQRLPGAAPAKPAAQTASPGGAPGAGPDTTTPAGPAPLVAPPAAAGSRPAETGTPAPEPEPPAPEGGAPARETPQVPNDVQEYLDASRGKGAPLPDATRKLFEAKFQRPLDDVRIHDDAGADDSAKKIDALAYTRGNDIYFRSGAYDPTGSEGKKLLAHELAHVVQQRPGINRKTSPGLGGTVIRRTNGSTSPAGTITSWPNPNNPNESIDTGGSAPSLKLDKLPVPAFKSTVKPQPIKWRTAQDKRSDKQRSNWLTDSDNVRDAKDGVTARLKKLVPGQKGPYRLQSKGETKSGAFYMGEPEEIGPALVIPPWDRDGKFSLWQVDHIAEWQIGGDDDKVTNYQLLKPKVNKDSGGMIQQTIYKQINTLLAAAPGTLKNKPKNWKQIYDANGSVTWQDLTPVTFDLQENDKLERKDIKTAEYMVGLEILDEGRAKDLEGTQERLAIYPDRAGGQVAHPDLKGEEYEYKSPSEIGRSRITKISWQKAGPNKDDTGVVGMAIGDIRGRKALEGKLAKWRKDKLEVPILGMPPFVPWGGFLDREAVKAERERILTVNPFSPVVFDELNFDLDHGLSGRGVVPKPDVKLLERASIAVILEDGEVGIEATITADELQLPGPFKVQGGSLTLKATTGELSVIGTVNFEIQKVATGFIRAREGTSTGFALDAELQFDKKMFDGDAKIKGSYADGKWAVEGTLGVGEDKIKGIKKASATVKVTEDTVTADGEFETSIKGVDKGKLGFKYDKATGMEITGEITLGQGIPGIKSGKLDATIKEGPTGHSLSGDVTIEPSVPGLTGTVTGKYEDGAFLVEANLGYEKGLAKGSVQVGVTNQAPGADGKPTGPPKKDGSLRVYGGGTVTLTLTPWLQGTVGLKLTERGEIEVTGEVALPSTFEVFKERAVEKQLLSIGIDIPIIGVAVAGQRIGIFATIRGGVSISAGFGPGELRDVALKVTYNPAKPDDTTVSGRGNFVVPAHAGLRLSVDGGLGAGIPIVSATAGLTVFGEIGVAGAATAGVAITWTPRSGIVLDAKGEIFVEPKFKFGIEAFVDVSADLWITTIELYHHKWKLADFEYGSNLRFGLSFPIHYESGKPFDLSFDQIQWTYPHIEPTELLGGLMKQLVG